jgi:hypothetical protein
MKSILKQIRERLLYGKLSLVFAVVILACAGSSFFLRKPHAVQYPTEPISPSHGGTEQYLRHVMSDSYKRFTEHKINLRRIPTVPVVSAEDFPLVVLRVEELLRQSWRGGKRHIVIGSVQPMALDATLLTACDQPLLLDHVAQKTGFDLTLNIVAPATLSAESQAVLEENGLHIRRFPSRLKSF